MLQIFTHFCKFCDSQQKNGYLVNDISVFFLLEDDIAYKVWYTKSAGMASLYRVLDGRCQSSKITKKTRICN